MAVGRAVEQHLPVPAHGDQGGPRAGCHGHNRTGPGLGNERFGRQVFGHGRNTGRLPQGRRVKLEFKLRLGLDRSGGARGLECTALDPFADHIDLGVGNLGRAGRHLGLFLVGNHAQERAALGVARLDDLARSASLQRRPIAIEVQPSLGLVGVVAGAAATAEDPRHVIRVGDLLLGLGIIGTQGRHLRQPTEEGA